MKDLEAVLKVGGSLSRSESLGLLCEEIGRLGIRQQLLVVPGGGEFADIVRDYYRLYQLSETTAHRMALLAMDQYGCLLGDLIPNSALVSDLLSARAAAAAGRVPILLPSALIVQADPLPHSWQVTSDSIAAWIAGQANASQLILLKVIDGFFTNPTPMNSQVELISDMAVFELDSYPGIVDEYFSKILVSLHLETWLINGLYPPRLVELMTSGRTTGTRIRQGAE
jgi:5-(aminomethyl)-3-furanmethanol phosphate kinase